MDFDTYDVAIIGGGAAGLSAALVLGRARRRVVVVDAGAPRNAPAARMQGFISRDGTAPADLLAAARAEIAHYGVEVIEDCVVDATPGFTLELAVGDAIQARHVLLTTGAADVLPDVEGARARWGRDLLHCPYCHGWEIRDQPVGVLGTGAGSVEHAHLLRQWTDDVTFFTHAATVTDAERATLAARGIAIADGTVERLVVVNDRLRAVELAGGERIERAALFIRPALRAHPVSPAAGLGCGLTPDGLVETDRQGRTTVPGLWAAGNATNPRAQVITAAGEGSAAAIAINTDLLHADIAAVAACPERTHDEPDRSAQPPPARPDDLDVRLPDPDRDQPDPERLAGFDGHRHPHLRARHDRGADRDLRPHAAPASRAGAAAVARVTIASRTSARPPAKRASSSRAVPLPVARRSAA
jgi:thioredoxin reductase